MAIDDDHVLLFGGFKISYYESKLKLLKFKMAAFYF